MTRTKARLDVVLAERGLVQSRERAQALILAGAVTVDGSVVVKAAAAVELDAAIEVTAPGDEFASRGGHKLSAALDAFDMTADGMVAVDVGASTGGFTDVLLRAGAARVYAIDVGYGQLAWRLRTDPRVVVMERTNFRNLESLPERPRIATVDVSFIGLRLILPALSRVTGEDCEAIVLIKPQFEAGRENIEKGGVVRDPAVHRAILDSVIRSAGGAGWGARGLIASPLLGPAGNREFLAHLSRVERPAPDIKEMVDSVVATESPRL